MKCMMGITAANGFFFFKWGQSKAYLKGTNRWEKIINRLKQKSMPRTQKWAVSKDAGARELPLSIKWINCNHISK